MEIDIALAEVEKSRQYWDDEGLPLFRQPENGEKILILGWSIGQGKEVLLSRELKPDEDYGDAAAEALNIIDDYLPSGFVCEGKLVAKIETGFSDGMCDWYSEVTFDQPWHVTLLQNWLDKQGAKICIQPSEESLQDKAISDHVVRAEYKIDIDKKMRYAAFRHMSIQNAIRLFVTNYWDAHKALPYGNHHIDGVDVYFK